MKITKLSNSFTVEYNGNTTQHGFNTLTAHVGQLKDGVTIKEGSQDIACAPIDEITINGIQMTSKNMNALLEELFVEQKGEKKTIQSLADANHVDIVLTEKDSVISDLTNKESLYIYEDLSQPMIQDKSLIVKNSSVSYIEVEGLHISKLTLDSLTFDLEDDSEINVSGGMNEVLISNINQIGSVSVRLQNTVDVNNVSRDVKLTNIVIQADGSMYFTMASDTDQPQDSFQFNSITFPYEFVIEESNINSFTMSDCDLSNLESVSLSSLVFNDQATCDALFSYLLAMSVDGHIYVAEMNINPSQSVQDALIAKGITLTIE